MKKDALMTAVAIAIWLGCIFPSGALAGPRYVDFVWVYDTSVKGFNIYRGNSSLTCTDSINIEDPTLRSYSGVINVEEGYNFWHMTAYSETEESGKSNELISKIVNGVLTYNYLDYVLENNGVTVSWEGIPSIFEYILEYQKVGDQAINSLRTSNLQEFIYLEPGVYDIEVKACDAQGRAISNSNVYQKIQVVIANPPPLRPSIKIDSSNMTMNQKLMVAIKNYDPSVVENRIYLSTTNNGSQNLMGDVYATCDPNHTGYCNILTNENYCNTVDVTTLDIVFIAVTAINANGVESEPTFGYELFGNIKGTFNEGVPYQQAIVNGDDLNVIRSKTIYGIKYTPRSTNFCAEPNLYDMLPLTYQESADFDLNGIVGLGEVNFIKYFYLNSGAAY